MQIQTNEPKCNCDQRFICDGMTSYCHSGLHGELDYHDCMYYKRIPEIDEAIIEAEGEEIKHD